MLYALAREPSPGGLFAEWSAATAVVEPYLFVVLAMLWLASPRLARLPYRHRRRRRAARDGGRAASLFFEIHRRLQPVPSVALLLLARCGRSSRCWRSLFYFHLRARALSPAIVEARLQALQARIRPHFLFNSINAVLSLVRKDPQRAEVALQDMADLFRVLMRDNRDLTPLADEVELCRQYLELEQLRLGERLHVDWNVKSMPGDALVPPLVLQPLLENAVYHGIEPSSEPGTVSINVFLTRGEVHAILKNPYRDDGGRHHSGNKMALANVRERLALHFDAEASLESRVTKDGYEVHITMPYRTADPDAVADAQKAAAAQVAIAAAMATARAAACGRLAFDQRAGCPWLSRRCAFWSSTTRRRRGAACAISSTTAATALPITVVGEAQHGREALDLLQSAPADLVLTDIHMPDMDGIELARHLLKLSHPPVVIFTTAFHEHAVQAFEVNAIDYLMKPVRVQRLLGALQKVPRLKPVSAEKLLHAAGVGAPLPVGDRALARRAGAARRHRLPQGRAQVHHDPHRAARVPARGVADQARGRVRQPLRARAPQLPRLPRLHPRLRAPRQRRRRLALGGAA